MLGVHAINYLHTQFGVSHLILFWQCEMTVIEVSDGVNDVDETGNVGNEYTH